TAELHERMAVAERVRIEAEALGMSEVQLEAVSPEQFVNHGTGIRGGTLPGPRFLMDWTEATVAGPVYLSGESLALWVYGRGDEAWGEPAVLEVGLAGQAAPAATVTLPRRPEVAEVVLAAGGLDDATLQIRHTNVGADSPRLVEWFWPRTRVVHLFSAYAGSVDC
ncbi:MAG: hypothetical protein KY394_03140, partial [Actinobacteria bacterium]|nr:hypothetical protein [Actinomycetota bacterium]